MVKAEQLPLGVVRQTFYQLLKVLFDYPTAELIGMIQDGTLMTSLQPMVECLQLPMELLEDLSAVIEQLPANPEALLDQLSVEYTRLFINAYPKAAVSPYARVHLEGENQAVKEPEVFWRKIGVQLKAKWTELPDHVVAEFGFMNYLVKHENQLSQKKYEQLQGEFVREHLAYWVPKFLSQVIAETQDEFYRVIAQITLEFIKRETEYLAVA